MLIYATGYWNDDQAPINALCHIGLDVDDLLDDSIFYYFEENEPIIGSHSDFTITAYEVTK